MEQPTFNTASRVNKELDLIIDCTHVYLFQGTVVMSTNRT